MDSGPRTRELASLLANQLRGDLAREVRENTDYDGSRFVVTNTVLNPKKD